MRKATLYTPIISISLSPPDTLKFNLCTLFSGGYDGKFRLDTTEIYVAATGQFELGPTLPFGVDQHCMSNVNDTHYVLIGGRHEYDDLVSKQAWLYDMGTDVWTQLPDLQTDRYWSYKC